MGERTGSHRGKSSERANVCGREGSSQSPDRGAAKPCVSPDRAPQVVPQIKYIGEVVGVPVMPEPCEVLDRIYKLSPTIAGRVHVGYRDLEFGAGDGDDDSAVSPPPDDGWRRLALAGAHQADAQS